MVSNQKPIKNLRKDPNEATKTDNSKELQTRINTVLNACQDIIQCNNSYINKKNVNKKNSTGPVKIVKKNASEVTLEKVAQDMTNILKDLKDHLPTFKTKNDSFSDVVPKLEESFLKSNENRGKKKGFFKNCKAEPPITPKPQSCQNSTRPKSAGNIKNNNVNNRISAYEPKNTSPSPQGTVIKTSRNKPVTHSANASTTGSTRSNASSRQSNMSNFNHFCGKLCPKLEYNPLGVLKAEVQKAIKEKKTFTIKGTFPAVRRALLKRGWIEKIQISHRDKTNDDLKKFHTYSIQELVALIRNKDIAETCKKLIKSKLLATHQVDFYWSFSYESFKECPDKIKLTKINKFRYNLFSYANKLGLCYANKNSVWFRIPGVANLNHPRTYSLTRNGDTPEFIKDFHRTAAMSLLKWVVKNSDTGEYKVLSQSGKIPIEVFDFAINECYKFIKKAQHEDIDNEIKEALDYEWTEFLNYFYKTVHIGNHFRKISDVTEIDMVRKANFILNKLNIYWPYLEMDGLMNIWILKPIDCSQGVGIHMCRTLQYVLKIIRANPNRRYIIQKYIERPLLIHNTKFDIRQWFLIGGTVPLTIWMYKQCYIRFSSQTYNLRKLHESIHLTNNAVQSRYRQANRDIALPSYNMWDSDQFKNYLSDIGYPNAYNTIIYPGMKQCIIAAVLMHQDKLDRRKNCFELYGADFMLTEDFKPWLIEINANPALHASTPITARMCPLVLEDVIKVVVDYDADKSASTGSFELVYEKNLPMNLKNPNLQVQGIPVTANYFYEPEVKEVKPPEVEKIITQSFPNMRGPDAIDYVKHIGNGMRKTLEDLLLILRKEKEKRHARKNKSVITVLSNIITETKESQTEYRNRSRIISETFIKSQILEVQEPEMCQKGAKNKKQILPATNASMLNSGSKHKGDSEDNSIGIQVQKKKPSINKKPQENEKKTIIKSKTNVNIGKGNKETKPIASNKANIKVKPQKEMEIKSLAQPKLDVTENLQENGEETVTINQSKSDKNKSLQGIEKEVKTTIESKLDINEKHQENKNEIIQPKLDVIEENQNGNKAQIIIPSMTVVNKKFQENGRKRKLFSQSKSYTYGKSQQNEKEPEIIFQCKSDIRNFQENEDAKLIIQYESDINEKLQENREEANTITQSKSNTYELPKNEKEKRTVIPPENKQNETEAKKDKKNTVKTSDHNSSLHSNPEQLDKVKIDKCNLNTSNTLSVTNFEIKDKTQTNSVSRNASKTTTDNALQLSDAAKKTLLNCFLKAKQYVTDKQQ